MNTRRRLFWIKSILVFFIIALGVSGFTAIPLHFELKILDSIAGVGTIVGEKLPMLAAWISFVHNAIDDLYQDYAFLGYGYDWLAFGHFVIAIAFLGAVRDPIRNLWVLEFGMIACVLIIPYALIFGQIRGIPFLWRTIDMLFGILGVIPLTIARKMIIELETD